MAGRALENTMKESTRTEYSIKGCQSYRRWYHRGEMMPQERSLIKSLREPNKNQRINEGEGLPERERTLIALQTIKEASFQGLLVAERVCGAIAYGMTLGQLRADCGGRCLEDGQGNPTVQQGELLNMIAGV